MSRTRREKKDAMQASNIKYFHQLTLKFSRGFTFVTDIYIFFHRAMELLQITEPWDKPYPLKSFNFLNTPPKKKTRIRFL